MSRTDEILKEIETLKEDLLRIDELESREDADDYNIPDREEWKFKLENKKAELKGIIQGKKETRDKLSEFVKFLNCFDWFISKDTSEEALNQGVRLNAGREHFRLIIEDQISKNNRIQERIEELNQQIKSLDEEIRRVEK